MLLDGRFKLKELISSLERVLKSSKNFINCSFVRGNSVFGFTSSGSHECSSFLLSHFVPSSGVNSCSPNF